MDIRKATPEDAKFIADFLFLAMEEITYGFIGRNNANEAKELLALLAGQPANQYSFENTWIIEEDGTPVGSANIYDGAKLNELREPVATIITQSFGVDFNPEDETQAGEYYLDCIGVSSNRHGSGIGTRLLQFLIEKYVREDGRIIGLLVDKENPQAKRLYLKKGFKVVGQKSFGGKIMDHLQIKPDDLIN